MLASSPLGDGFFRDVIPTAPPIAALARSVLVTLAPIPLLIAIRSVAGGLVVASRRTHLIAMTSMIRIAVVLGSAAAVLVLHWEGGARAAAWMLLTGILAETVGVVALAFRELSVRRLVSRRRRGALRTIAALAGPLAVATLAWTASRGVIHAVLGHLRLAGLAQAAFGVILPLMMVTCAPLWALLDTCLVLPRSRADFTRLIGYAAVLCAISCSTLALLAGSAMGRAWLTQAFGLGPELSTLLAPALGTLTLAPPLVAARALAQAVLVKAHRAGVMMITGPVRVFLMLIVGLMVAGRRPDVNGAALALALVLGAEALDAAVLGLKSRAACRHAGGLGAVLRGTHSGGPADPRIRPQPAVALEPEEMRSAA
jgi:hypothetical protein